MSKKGVRFKLKDTTADAPSEKRLTAQDLRQRDVVRHKKNKETYRGILADCEKRIKYHNGLGNNQTIIKVPSMKFDTPPYDITHAMMYVIRKLKKNGFKINNIRENEIYISW